MSSAAIQGILIRLGPSTRTRSTAKRLANICLSKI